MADQTTVQCALAETWHINNRVNLLLLDALSDEQLAATILPRGRAVASYFVHIHMARFYWLERRAPALAKSFNKIPGGTAPRATLRQALIDSGGFSWLRARPRGPPSRPDPPATQDRQKAPGPRRHLQPLVLEQDLKGSGEWQAPGGDPRGVP